MNRGEFWKLGGVSDEMLVSDLKQLVIRNAWTEARVVAHVAELEARGIHLASGRSLFRYCQEILGLSQNEAFYRIQAARMARQFPVIFGLLEQRAVHLTALALIRDFITEDNHRELLREVSGKTKEQILVLLASRAPRPDVASTIRRLPVGRLARGPRSVAAGPTGRLEPISIGTYRLQLNTTGSLKAKLELAANLMSHANPSRDLAVVVERALDLLLEKLQNQRFGQTKRPCNPPIAPEHSQKGGSELSRGNEHSQKGGSELSRGNEHSRKGGSELSRGSELSKKDADEPPHKVRDELPRGDRSGEAVQKGGDELQKGGDELLKEAQGERPVKEAVKLRLKGVDELSQNDRGELPRGEGGGKASQEVGDALVDHGGRGVPQVEAGLEPEPKRQRRMRISRAVLRALVERDGLGCTFVGGDGRCCGERAFLQVHHEQAWAKGGADSVGNLRLVCAAHNRLLAEREFGRGHVQRAVERSRARRNRQAS